MKAPKVRRIWLEPRSRWVSSWTSTVIDPPLSDDDKEQGWQTRGISLMVSDCANLSTIEFGYRTNQERLRMQKKLNRLQSSLDIVQEALDAE